MRFKLEIKMDNAAFDEPTELPRILQDIARRCTGDIEAIAVNGPRSVYDVNGNVVGTFDIIGARKQWSVGYALRKRREAQKAQFTR